MDQLRPELMRLTFYGLVVMTAVACSDRQATTVASAVRPAGVVDSIADPQAAIARFVSEVTRPSGFSGGATSVDRLVENLMTALSRNDTSAVAGMLMTRAEYGFDYYPTSVYSKPPYQLAPEIAWMLSSQASAKGLRRMFARFGDQEMKLLGHSCEKVVQEGLNTVFSECTVTFTMRDGGSHTFSLFRSLIVRNGQAKFLSYSGDF